MVGTARNLSLENVVLGGIRFSTKFRGGWSLSLLADSTRGGAVVQFISGLQGLGEGWL